MSVVPLIFLFRYSLDRVQNTCHCYISPFPGSIKTKLINIKLKDKSDKLEIYIIEIKVQNTEGASRVDEIQLKCGETNIIINAKLFLDINNFIEDIKINLKYSEQDIKNKLLEKKKEFILDAAKLVEEQQTILRNHFERNILSELEKCKSEAVKDVIQLIYNKGLFNLFENEDQIVIKYLTFTTQ